MIKEASPIFLLHIMDINSHYLHWISTIVCVRNQTKELSKLEIE